MNRMILALLFQISSSGDQQSQPVEPVGVPDRDLVPLQTALLRLSLNQEQFEKLISTFESSPVITFNKDEFIHRSILSLLAKYIRERSWDTI